MIHSLNIIITKLEWCKFEYKHWCTLYLSVLYNLSKFKKINWYQSQNTNTSAFTDFFPNLSQGPSNWESRSTKCSDWKIKKLGLLDIWSCFWSISFLKILIWKKITKYWEIFRFRYIYIFLLIYIFIDEF